MQTPLYKLYLFKRTPAYFASVPQKIAALRERMAERQRELGIRDVFNAEMAWSNEQYEYFGVEFYPSLEALQAYTRCLGEMGFYQYVQGESFLGIPMDNHYPDFAYEPAPSTAERASEPDAFDFGFTPAEEAPRQPIYRVYFSRPALGLPLVSEEEREEIQQRVQEAGQMLGVEPLVSAFMRWNHERWEYFGIERFQDMETAISYSQYLNECGWYRLTEAVSYLGSPISGLATG